MNDVIDIPLDVVIARLRANEAAARALGVTRLSIFGSRARGDARPDSDLDILLDTTAREEIPAFDFFKVQHLIEDTTGIPTQLTLRKFLKARVAERIADDLIEVF